MEYDLILDLSAPITTTLKNPGLCRTEFCRHNNGKTSLLDLGLLPVEDLAKLAVREGQRPRQLYQTHKWFARRFGSAFRALLIAAVLPVGSDFWASYYRGMDLRGYTVLDPFVGGGTSIIESMRLGANVIGIDIDSVACSVTRFETHMAKVPDLIPTLNDLKCKIGTEIEPFYKTQTEDGEERDVLHYFWVQLVKCRYCGTTIEAHPHYQLAYEAKGTKQWVFCPGCHEIHELNLKDSKFFCKKCSTRVSILEGSVRRGKITCPSCNRDERLIDVASRTNNPPVWHIFALETLEPPARKRLPMAQRCFRPASDFDQSIYSMASSTFKQRLIDAPQWTTSRRIPTEGRADDRLLKYGYKYYKDIFNRRQLIHLSYLAEAIDQLIDPIREAMIIAFSDHLKTNCMMTSYAFGWRRLVPLFSVRAYWHVTRPVEINPWIDGTGRGTFPNAVRQIQRAIQWTHSPIEPLVNGGFRHITDFNNSKQLPLSRVIQSNSQNLSFLNEETVDIVLTDPPYFDNISYSELSDFFLAWQQLFNPFENYGGDEEAFRENISANGRNCTSIDKFQNSLQKCFLEISRVLKSNGRVIFTYQHKTPGAWYALASALHGSGLRPIQLIPLLGDSSAGPHKHKGSSKWDAVFVLVKDKWMNASGLNISEEAIEASQNHCSIWAKRLENTANGLFGSADKENFYRACLVGAALCMFPTTIGGKKQQKPLKQILADNSISVG